jgi:hypothetical protein
MLPEPPENDASSESEQALLLTFLRDRSHPCPVCGYDLRNLDNARCPECGRELRLTVTELRPVHAPFVAGLIALAAPVGASATGIAGVLYYRLAYGPLWEFLKRPLLINTIVLAVSVPALALWLRSARRLRRRTLATQWRFAAAAWAATLLGLVICLVIG